MNETIIRKGTIMKKTTLPFLGLACLMAMPSIAHARYRDGMNLYQYVRSAPVTRVDPYGLESSPPETPKGYFKGIQTDRFGKVNGVWDERLWYCSESEKGQKISLTSYEPVKTCRRAAWSGAAQKKVLGADTFYWFPAWYMKPDNDPNKWRKIHPMEIEIIEDPLMPPFADLAVKEVDGIPVGWWRWRGVTTAQWERKYTWERWKYVQKKTLTLTCECAPSGKYMYSWGDGDWTDHGDKGWIPAGNSGNGGGIVTGEKWTEYEQAKVTRVRPGKPRGDNIRTSEHRIWTEGDSDPAKLQLPPGNCPW